MYKRQAATAAAPSGNDFSQFTGGVMVDHEEQKIIGETNAPHITTPETFGLSRIPADLGKGFARELLAIPQDIGSSLVETGEIAKGNSGKSALQTAKDSFVNRYVDSLKKNGSAPNIFQILPMIWGAEKDAALNLAFDNEGASVVSNAGYNMIKENQASLEKMGLVPKGKTTMAYDVGGGFAQAAIAIGSIVLTKNPELAAGYTTWITNSRDYLESRKAGKTPEDSAAIAAASAGGQGALQLIGGHYFMAAAKSSSFIKTVLLRTIGQAAEQGAQAGVGIGVKNAAGVRDQSLQEGLMEMGYSALIGAIAGAPISAIATHIEMQGKSLGVPDDVAKDAATKLTDNYSELQDAGAALIDKETTGLGTDPALIDASVAASKGAIHAKEAQIKDTINPPEEAFKGLPTSHLEAQLQHEKDYLASLESIDTRDYPTEDLQQLNTQINQQRVQIDTLQSTVSKRLGEIDAQNGKGLLPVPRAPETLSEFLKSKGGIKLETGEARMLTRKESPALKGVANKNGTLSLDEARRLAVEEGFITDHGGEGVSKSDYQDLLDALDNENNGVPVVRDAHLEAVMAREHVLQYNEERIQANEEIAANSKKLKSFKQAFKEGASLAKKDAKLSQESIIKALDDAQLRPEDKAKFIKKIKNIQTPEQLNKAAPDIISKVAELLDADTKRTIRARIQKVISSAKGRKNIAIDTVEEVRALEDSFKKSGILGSGIKETPVSDFKDALDRTLAMVAGGDLKLQIIHKQKEEIRAARLSNLAADTVPLNNKSIKEAGLNDVLTATDKIKNKFTEGMNKVQRLNINKNPMDVIFDILDGNKNYNGANSRIFKRTIDKAHSNYLQLKEATTRDVKNLADTLDLNEVNYKRIGAWAALQQEGGKEKLIHTGITEKEIAELKLSEPEMQMYNLMREKLDSLRPALKEVMRVAYNKDFTKVKDYFPFMTDFKAMDDLEIQQMFGDDALQISEPAKEYNSKDVKKGFTKERTLGKQKIRIDAMGVFLNHVDNATYLIGLGQDIKELGGIAQSPEYGRMAGDFGQVIVSDWINLIAKKGRMSGQNDFLNGLRVNVGTAALGFKLSSALIQPTALQDGASFVGGSYIARGIKNVADDGWRKFMHDNMPEIRERVGDDPAYLEMGGKGTLAHYREAGMWALKKLDHLAASAVASGAYIKSVESRGGKVDLSVVDPIAIEESALAVRRTQSSSFAKDAAPVISQAKLTGNISVDKLILQFQSFMFNRWSLIQHDFWNAGVKEGKTGKALNIATWLILANATEVGIRHYTKDLVNLMTGSKLEDNKDDTTAIGVAAQQALSNIPFVSSFVSAAQYGSVPVPSISLIEGITNELAYAQKSKSEDKKIKHYGLAGLQATGVLFGIPGTMQATQAVKSATKDTKRQSKSSTL